MHSKKLPQSFPNTSRQIRASWNNRTYLLLILASVLSCSHQPPKPKNIILFIGDGMGLSQVTAGRIVNGKLRLDKFPTAGFVTTHSSDNLITDSAAAMTAMATGHKSYNGAISVSPDGDTLKTIFEYAKEKGMSTGLVVTCTVTHATPAALVTHVDTRTKHEEIARQMTESDLDVIIGGGRQYFLPGTHPNSKREDDLDLIEKLAQKMKVVFTVEEMHKNKDAVKLAVFLADDNPATASKRPYTLAELTKTALNILTKNQNGFILLVEGSQIDWGGHDNLPNKIINEMIDFDDAIGVGLDYSSRNTNTLIVVSADHETGGFAIHHGSIAENIIDSTAFTSTHHTGTMVPVFSKGPGKASFGGIIDNTDIGKILKNYIVQ